AGGAPGGYGPPGGGYLLRWERDRDLHTGSILSTYRGSVQAPAAVRVVGGQGRPAQVDHRTERAIVARCPIRIL
ncbi:MAG: hypothetical protein ACT4NY_32085, partial [Pseudonocardiales bacterium]